MGELESGAALHATTAWEAVVIVAGGRREVQSHTVGGHGHELYPGPRLCRVDDMQGDDFEVLRG